MTYPNVHCHDGRPYFVIKGCILADFFVAGALEVRYSVKPPSIPGSSPEDPGVKRLTSRIPTQDTVQV